MIFLKARQCAYYFFLMLVFAGCSKDSLHLIWDNLSVPLPGTFSRMVKDDSGRLWLCGGNPWESGGVWMLDTASGNLQPSLVTEKALLGLTISSNGLLAATGVDGHIWFQTAGNNVWQYSHPGRWDIARSISWLEKDRLVICGGNQFEAGFHFLFWETEGAIHQVNTLNRVNDILALDSLNVILIGYGLIMYSTDGGVTWEFADADGDIYMQMDFPSRTTGFVVGYTGSLLKTIDGGFTWKELRRSRRVDTRHVPFRGVCFRDENVGAVMGDNGILWITKDGGDSWKEVTGLPGSIDFHTGCFIGDFLYVAGEGGAIFRTKL